MRLPISIAVAAAAVFTMVALIPAYARPQSDPRQVVEEVSRHFASVATMTGEFVQFGPSGEQTGGTFYIERPGKIRFRYEEPAQIEVISNGRTLAVHNKKLDNWSFYPLSQTPLKLLLADRIEYDEEIIQEVISENDLTTIVMGDSKIFGDSIITLMFDPATHDLRQWTIRDPNGKETSVMVFNVEKNVKFADSMFYFDERAIRSRLQERNTQR